MKYFTEEVMQRIFLAVTVIGALMIIYISIIVLYPTRLIEFKQPFNVISPDVGRNNFILTYEVEYCASRELFVTMNRQLENTETGILWDVPGLIMHMTKGCGKEMQSVPIPEKIAVGTYKVHSDISIKINALRTEDFIFESESFRVGDY